MGKDNGTSFDERAGTSEIRSRFRCTHCDREFKSGHALGGHCNSHSKKERRRYKPRTVGRVIRVPIIPANDVEPPPVAPRHEDQSGSTEDDPTALGLQSGVNYESGDESSSTRPLGGLKKILKVKEEAPDHDQVGMNNGVTLDLTRTMNNPIVEVSGKENGDTKFMISNKNGDEDLDLELRLGFGPV